MKKNILYLIIIVVFFGCKSFIYNSVLESKGVFDDEIKLQKLEDIDKEVVFFPISHLGTAKYYNDVNKKIDSLKMKNYFFYYEKIKNQNLDTISFRKFRKVTLLPYLKGGYKEWVDSVLKIELKKKLINQPSYETMGLDASNSKNIDVSIHEMISYYEKNYSEIILEPCDINTSVYKESSCKNTKKDKVFAEQVILNFRNRNVINYLVKDSLQKVAIIYGSNHIPGMKQELIKLGYK